jgi:hypothetical protein
MKDMRKRLLRKGRKCRQGVSPFDFPNNHASPLAPVKEEEKRRFLDKPAMAHASKSPYAPKRNIG